MQQKIKRQKLKLKITNSINYEIINNLLDKTNGNITIIKDKDNINLILSINQRLISEYDIISKKKKIEISKLNIIIIVVKTSTSR